MKKIHHNIPTNGNLLFIDENKLKILANSPSNSFMNNSNLSNSGSCNSEDKQNSSYTSAKTILQNKNSDSDAGNGLSVLNLIQNSVINNSQWSGNSSSASSQKFVTPSTFGSINSKMSRNNTTKIKKLCYAHRK